jgi:phosphoglycerate dehydrogenase-like enzyme
MTHPAIFVATDDAPDYVSLLRDQLDPHVKIATASSPEDAVSLYDGQPVVLAKPDFAVKLLQTEPPVQWVQSTWAGVTPLIELPFRDYQLTGVKDVFGAQMSEYVLGYLLAHELDLSRRKQAQLDKQWDQSAGGRIEGKTLGVMGTGSIGSHLARTAQQLGLRVLGFNSSGRPVAPFEQVYEQASLATFLRQCDYVVGILPDLPQTTNLIDSKALNVMRKSAVLINVGRGNLIDEHALCQALEQEQIAAAVLDVFKQEPLPPDNPLWSAANCTITAHVAAVSHPQDVVEIFLKNYRLFAAGEPLQHLVSFDKGY